MTHKCLQSNAGVYTIKLLKCQNKKLQYTDILREYKIEVVFCRLLIGESCGSVYWSSIETVSL